MLHLFPHWNWSAPGQPVNVWAFGNCQAVELFTNGVSMGRQTLNVQSHVEWDNVSYASGTLQAIGYNNGLAVITNTVVTTGTPAAIALWPDRSTILADGQDVSVVTVAVLDSRGLVVPTATNEINFSITGGAILGVGNGNPSSHEADKASQRAVFNGLAEVIIQSANQTGSITLTATSAGLISTNIIIMEAGSPPAPAAPAGVAAVGGNAQVTVSWDVVPGATTYNLWRATTSGGPYTLMAGNLGGVNLGYTDNNVTNLTTYYYVVTANGNGASVNSAEVKATPAAIVTGLTATATNGQIVLNWNGSAGANYNVKRSLVTGGPYTTIAASITNTNYTDSGLTTCLIYYYVVTITNAGNESLASVEASADITGTAATTIRKCGRWRRWSGRQRFVLWRAIHDFRVRCRHLGHQRRVPVRLCLCSGQHQLRHPRPSLERAKHLRQRQGRRDDPRNAGCGFPARVGGRGADRRNRVYLAGNQQRCKQFQHG